MGEVIWLGRYPVKSMQGEPLDTARLRESGVDGDRRYGLIDRDTGLVASAKNPRKWRDLLRMSATYQPDGRVEIALPDGRRIGADDPATDTVLSDALGRAVRLTDTRPDGASMERLTPQVEADAGTMTRGQLAGGTPGDTFVDYAPVHIVTTATLDALGADGRRFRPNIIVRMLDRQPFAENAWTGRTLTIGAHATVRVIAPTPRCAVPTLAHGHDLGPDPRVLRTAAELNRVQVLDYGVLTCVGAYASVDHDGPIRIGDLLTVG